MQLYDSSIFYEDGIRKYFKDQPVISKGTGPLSSLFRATIRDTDTYSDAFKITVKHGKKRINNWLKNDKRLNEFNEEIEKANMIKGKI